MEDKEAEEVLKLQVDIKLQWYEIKVRHIRNSGYIRYYSMKDQKSSEYTLYIGEIAYKRFDDFRGLYAHAEHMLAGPFVLRNAEDNTLIMIKEN